MVAYLINLVTFNCEAQRTGNTQKTMVAYIINLVTFNCEHKVGLKVCIQYFRVGTLDDEYILCAIKVM